MMQITLFGWSVEDDLRANALADERSAAVPVGSDSEEATGEREAIRPPVCAEEDLRPAAAARDG